MIIRQYAVPWEYDLRHFNVRIPTASDVVDAFGVTYKFSSFIMLVVVEFDPASPLQRRRFRVLRDGDEVVDTDINRYIARFEVDGGRYFLFDCFTKED